MAEVKQQAGMAQTGGYVRAAWGLTAKLLTRHRRTWAFLVVGLVLVLSLLANAVAGCSIGFADLVWPISVSVQFSGFFLLLTGVIGAVGVFAAGLLTLRALGFVTRDRPETSPLRLIISVFRDVSMRPLSLVAAAALAGIYIDLTIAFNALHYNITLVWIFGVLAAICVCAACLTLPAAWKTLGNGLKATGIVLAGLGTVAQFWYQSVYVPQNTQVGMIYTVSAGPVAQSGNNKVVQVNLTMEDAGSIPEVSLASMVVVYGISYPANTSTVLKVLQPINNTSYFWPGDRDSNEFLVTISPGMNAIGVELLVDVALSTKITLGSPAGAAKLQDCPAGTQSEWYIRESNLIRFTRGTQVLVSDWCQSGTKSFISAGIWRTRGGQFAAVPSADSDFIRDTSRYDALLIG